jgi:protein-disulfide isomerase
MNPGSNRLLLSISLALTACTILSPLEVLAAGPTGEPLTRQAFEQMIEQYIRSHPEVIEQSLQSLENKRAAEEQERQRAALATHQQELLNDPASPISGNPAGDVTVVEFFDYRCGYCKKAASALTQLQQSDARVRVVYKDFRFLERHQNWRPRRHSPRTCRVNTGHFMRLCWRRKTISPKSNSSTLRKIPDWT